ncbi:MAG: hypothetical protein H6739_28780 [Alphaproteobacteria bacterium]|nr:hypothetical protein [Alphaproteobacteria bacterium]
MTPLLDRLPRSAALIVLVGVALVLPTLGVGLVMDDVLMRLHLVGGDTAWGAAPWWDQFTFARPDLNEALRDAGFVPWWADPAVKMTFFRPLAAATHVLDYALWPDVPALHHLHSVLWYGAVVAGALAVFRLLHPASPRISALAGLIFAVSAPHAITVAWLSARNTMIAVLFGFALLGLHVRGRQSGRVGLQLAAVMVLAVGLLSGEGALGGLGWVIAWQLCLDEAPWPRRLAALVPYGAVVVAWRVAYVAAGFGAQHSGIYHDPASDLPGFLGAVGFNLPVLLMSRWLLLPLDYWSVLPPRLHPVFLGLAAVVLPLVAAVLWPLLRAEPRARFWALGTALCLVPFTATMPMDRLLMVGGLGPAALIAMLAAAPPASRPARAGVGVLLALHLPISTLLGPIRVASLPPTLTLFSTGFEQAPRDAAVPDQTFVYVAGTFHRVHYTTLMRLTAGDPAVPRRSVVLSSVFSNATVTRTAVDTLEIVPEDGYMLVDVDRIHRADPTACAVGDVVPLPDLDVEILALTPDGRPAKAAFRFHVPLEDPSLRWLVVDAEDPDAFPPLARTRAFPLPAVGETVETWGLGLPL